MAKVYVVLRGVDYEGDKVVGVRTSMEAAIELANEDLKEMTEKVYCRDTYTFDDGWKLGRQNYYCMDGYYTIEKHYSEKV